MDDRIQCFDLGQSSNEDEDRNVNPGRRLHQYLRRALRLAGWTDSALCIEEMANGAGAKGQIPKRFAIQARRRASEFKAECIGAEYKFDLAFFLRATVPGLKASKLLLTLRSFPLDVFRYFHNHALQH